jgi:STE24 endopeptidase
MAITHINPKTTYFWFKELALGIILAQYLFEQYLNKRQLTRLQNRKGMPAELKQVDIKEEDFDKSTRYSIDKMSFEIKMTFIKTIIDCLLIWFLYFPYLWNLAGDLLLQYGYDKESEFYRGLLFIAIETFRDKIISVPISLYSTFVIEQKHGFNKQTMVLFVKDELIGLALKFVFMIPVLAGFLWAVESGGEYFYIYVEIFVVIVVLIMMTIYPHVIAPLFNKYTELEDGSLKEKIQKLAEEVDFPLKKVFVVDGSKRSSHSNAYFYGLGSNKRIVLFDTLLKQMHEHEILAVLAHELGHWKKGHVWRQMLNAFGQIFVLFYIYGLFMSNTDIFLSFGYKDKSIFIGVILFTMIYAPVSYGLQVLSLKLSRSFEFQADEFATRLRYGPLLSTGLTKLFKENAGDMDPDPMWASFNQTHPSFMERTKFIRKIQNSLTGVKHKTIEDNN